MVTCTVLIRVVVVALVHVSDQHRYRQNHQFIREKKYLHLYCHQIHCAHADGKCNCQEEFTQQLQEWEYCVGALLVR